MMGPILAVVVLAALATGMSFVGWIDQAGRRR